jgi:hypothetical protein
VSLSPGRYTQMRVVLAANGGATPLANSVLPTGGSEVALATPSAAQGGLKVGVNMDVLADKTADFVVDFDACRSIVKTASTGAYQLKPVINVVPRLSDVNNRVTGYVTSGLASTTLVSAQRDGVSIKATQPDANGKFTLAPLPEGTYDIVIASSGRALSTITGVPVTAAAATAVNANTNPISPANAQTLTASGVVTLTPAPAVVEALVLARKTYEGGPTVEVAATVADGGNGAFTLALPGGEARKAAYVANATSIVFTADSGGVSNKFTLQLNAGTATKTQDIQFTSSLLTGLVLTLP